MRRLLRVLVGLLIVVVVAYAAILGWLYFNQRGLQYFPSGTVVALAEAGLGPDAVAIQLTAADGGTSNGWYAPPSQPGKPVILYLKGNSGSFSEEHERYAAFVADGYGFLALDYRGFPASPGEISEANILADATAAYDYAAAQGAPIVIWGRSLGSGPATYLASTKDAQALILETPFLSAVTVAAERYWYIPVAWVMLDQFHSDQWIADVTEPVFVAHGTADTTIGVSNGERLFALAKDPKELWIAEGAGHSDFWRLGIWERVKAFLAREAPAVP